MQKKIQIIGVAATALVLTACSQVTKEAHKEIDKVQDKTTTLAADWEKQVSDRKLRRVRVFERAYLAPTVHPQYHGDPLPASWKTPGRSLRLPKPVTLAEVANELRTVHKIIVTIDDNERASRADTKIDEDGIERVVQRRQQGDISTDELKELTERIDLNGSYEDIFNHLAAIYQYDWQYERGVARFRKYVTETFELNALAGMQTYNAGIGASSGSTSQGAGSQGGGKGSLSTLTTLSLDAYQSVKTTLENSVLPQSATAEILDSSGGIAVTAPAWAMPDIRRFIKEENERLSRTIAVEIAIYSVTREKSNSSVASLDLAIQDLSDRWGVQFRNSGISAQAEGSGIVGNIFSVPLGSGINLQDTQLVAESFKKFGRTSSVMKDRSFVRSSKVTVFTNGREQGYTENINFAPVGSENNNTLVNGTDNEILDTGFSLGLRGRVSKTGVIFLNMKWSVRDLRELRQLENGTQIPTIDKTEGDEDVYLSPGETVILRSFIRRGHRATEKSGGNMLCAFFCQDDLGENEVQEFFVVVHADLLSKPRPLGMGR